MKRTPLQRRTPLKRHTRLNSKSRTNSKRRKYGKYLRSLEWKRIRTLVLLRDGDECRLCGAWDPESLHVHHIEYSTFGEETGEELVTLCKDHHDAEHEMGLANRLEFWRGRLYAVT